MEWTVLLVLLGILGLLVLVFWLLGERGARVLPSTKSFIHLGGLSRLLNFKLLHGYIYMRWQKFYLSFFINQVEKVSTSGLRRWWSSIYHAKVLTEDQAKKVITIDEDIPFQKIEKVVPYPVAHDLVLKAPPKITVYECGCRHARKNHCEPTQVCLWIGEPFADFMAEHHPKESRSLTHQEALSILKEEHERGHVHTAWFKDAMLDRFYVICNCCPCCCGGIEMMVKYGVPMLASSGFVASIAPDECSACGVCADICPFQALIVTDIAELNWEKCMGCGVCVDHCPNGAITLVRDERKGIPLDVDALQSDAVV